MSPLLHELWPAAQHFAEQIGAQLTYENRDNPMILIRKSSWFRVHSIAIAHCAGDVVDIDWSTLKWPTYPPRYVGDGIKVPVSDARCDLNKYLKEVYECAQIAKFN